MVVIHVGHKLTEVLRTWSGRRRRSRRSGSSSDPGAEGWRSHRHRRSMATRPRPRVPSLCFPERPASETTAGSRARRRSPVALARRVGSSSRSIWSHMRCSMSSSSLCPALMPTRRSRMSFDVMASSSVTMPWAGNSSWIDPELLEHVAHVRSWSLRVMVEAFTYCLPIFGRLAASVRFSSHTFPSPAFEVDGDLRLHLLEPPVNEGVLASDRSPPIALLPARTHAPAQREAAARWCRSGSGRAPG